MDPYVMSHYVMECPMFPYGNIKKKWLYRSSNQFTQYIFGAGYFRESLPILLLTIKKILIKSVRNRLVDQQKWNKKDNWWHHSWLCQRTDYAQSVKKMTPCLSVLYHNRKYKALSKVHLHLYIILYTVPIKQH